MPPLRFFTHWSLLLVVTGMVACSTLRLFRPTPRVCLGKDWRTVIMDSSLRRQASDSLGQGPRYFQRELHIDPANPPRPILLRNDSICTRALTEFDRVDPRPDHRPRERGYVFLVGDNYVVRDPTDELERIDRWAYAAVFDNSWRYHFYQGFYRCPGGPLPATFGCTGNRQ
jgi:hypothetical protein